MTNLSADQLETEAAKVVATFGAGFTRRASRLSPEVQGLVQHAIPVSIGSVAAWRVGEGPAVLLIHGFADSHALWTPLMAALKAARQAFVALDLPGHGASSDGGSSTEDGIEAVFAVAQALGPIKAVVAHSMSAATAICALAEGLPAEKAVMIATALPLQREFVRLESRVPPETPPEVIARAREILIATAPVTPRFDVTAAADRLRIPALLIHCRDDERWVAEGTAHVACHWRGSQTHLTQGLGHRAVARDPDVIARTLDFLVD